MHRLGLLLSVLLCGAGAGHSGPEKSQKYAILPPVAVVTVPQVRDLVKGDSGNVVLVNVWATWCKPCLEELPRIAELSREYADEPLRIILISADDEELADSTVKHALQKAGVNFQTYLVKGGGDEYFINTMSLKWSGALPTSFVYDRGGSLRDMLVGKQTYEKFEKSVKKLFGAPKR